MHTLISGLTYDPAFLTPDEQAALLAAVDIAPWSAVLRRRVQHYGYRYDYKARTILRDDYLGPLPGWAGALAQRLADAGIMEAVPDQLIVNEYEPGQGIAAHVDCPPCFGPTVISLSLGSGCVMDFTPVSGDSGDGQLSLYLAAGSLLALQGAARYEWKHGITKRRSDFWEGQKRVRGRRVSLTFRTVTLPPVARYQSGDRN